MSKLEHSMNSVLAKLGISYSVAWTPCESEKHAIIDTKEHKIIIFSKTEDEAWLSLKHELLEIELRPLLHAYREFANVLLSFIEKFLYQRKERFLENLPDNLSRIMFEVENARNGKG